MRQTLRDSGLARRGCLISANKLEREVDSVAPAEGLVDKPIWVRVCVVVITRSGATW